MQDPVRRKICLVVRIDGIKQPVWNDLPDASEGSRQRQDESKNQIDRELTRAKNRLRLAGSNAFF